MDFLSSQFGNISVQCHGKQMSEQITAPANWQGEISASVPQAIASLWAIARFFFRVVKVGNCPFLHSSTPLA